MRLIDCLPHQPPMRLLEEIVHLTRGQTATARRVAKPEDFYFQGHFPGQPVVPAVILIELLAQTGGLAVAAPEGPESPGDNDPRVTELRVAAIGSFKFPAAAGPGATLEACARVAGRLGSMYKIEGEVTADGRLVAAGSLTLVG